jgi:hypothetical protein
MIFSMQRASLYLIVLVTVVLGACRGAGVPAPQAPEATETSTQGAVSSSKKAVIPPGFPRTNVLTEADYSSLLSASVSVVDPSIRSRLTEARESFRFTLHDGTHTFSPRLKSMGLHKAEVRRDLVTTGDTLGDASPDVIAIVQYYGAESVLASELLVFERRDETLVLASTYVLGEAVPRKIGIANRTIRVRAELASKSVDMTFTPKQ